MITGNKLIKMFYMSVTEDKMVILINELGLEQPLIDEEYDLYKETSTTDSNNVGIDLTFYELEECNKTENPCFDKISWNHDNTISLPFELNLGFTYAECVAVLKKSADFKDKRTGRSRLWVIENKYMLSIRFKDESLDKITGAVVLAYRDEGIPDRYILNND